MESGSFALWATQNMSLTQSYYNQLLDITTCKNLACLLSMNAQEIFDTSRRISTLAPTFYDTPWNPVADGIEMTTHPWIALANGEVPDVPILHGSNSDEGSMFTNLPKLCTEKELDNYWIFYGFTSNEIAQLKVLYLEDKKYPMVKGVSKYYWAGMREYGDSEITCSTKYASQILSELVNRISPTYCYLFNHLQSDENFVAHASEIGYVFHMQDMYSSISDKSICDVISSYWGNFIVNTESNPGSADVGKKTTVEWPKYTFEKHAFDEN